jgi:4-hydroxybenzoate polyprenyltransferase
MSTVKNYLSLVKFSHTIFALPFAIIGFVLGVKAQQQSNATQLNYAVYFLLVLGCMVTARSAAMAFNRYLDSAFDAKNPRTAIREIPAGIISKKNALAFTIICCILFVACTYFINSICFYLSPVALFVILFYSYTKRFTFLCHVVLGVGLSLAPIGAYLAITAQFAVLPILLSVAVLAWVAGFDIIFALQDEAFDKENNLYSIPSFFGKAKALKVSTVLHIVSAAAILFAGYYGHLNWLYWLGAAGFCGMLVYQHSIVSPTDLSKVNLAFMTANGIASVVFAVFTVSDLLLL